MIWAFGPSPGTRHLAAVCQSLAEYDEVVARGALLFDGQRAVVHSTDPAVLFVRFMLEEPFRMPPTVLRFEDHQVAERVAAAGWHVLDGTLYRARLRGPGELSLDRVYVQEPSAVYEGREMPSAVLVGEAVA